MGIASENRCHCGEWKKEQYDECYDCARDTMQRENRLCECGQFKQSEYEFCYDCSRL